MRTQSKINVPKAALLLQWVWYLWEWHRDYLVDYLVLKQENLIFLAGLSDNASVPANCIMSHSSALYTYSLHFNFSFMKKKRLSLIILVTKAPECPIIFNDPVLLIQPVANSPMTTVTGPTLNVDYLMDTVLKRPFSAENSKTAIHL